MTPKEKAEDLIKKFSDENYFSETDILASAKYNSIIAVYEIIQSWNDDGNKRLDSGVIDYWQAVKKEIQQYE